jgi:MFS family permease
VASSARSQRGLDWLAFFLADVQTGFGPFISVYLTGQKWTQVEIGLALSIGTITTMLGQLPAGALVDQIADKRRIAQLAIVAIAASALLLALLPQQLPVAVAEVLHSAASCVLVPAMAAISLAMAGLDGMGERLGRNARAASIGNGFAAALLGACGFYVSERAVFLLTAALVLPALLALRRIDSADLRAAPRLIRRSTGDTGMREAAPLRAVLLDRRVLIFAVCVALFHHRRVHRRTATGGGCTVALGGPPGGGVGAPARADTGLRGPAFARAAVCRDRVTLAGRGRATAGWGERRGVRRDGAAGRRRPDARQRPVQPGARRAWPGDGAGGHAEHDHGGCDL